MLDPPSRAGYIESPSILAKPAMLWKKRERHATPAAPFNAIRDVAARVCLNTDISGISNAFLLFVGSDDIILEGMRDVCCVGCWQCVGSVLLGLEWK